MRRVDNDDRAQKDVKGGDVLMVAMELEDKQKKGKTFTWRFFALVLKISRGQRCEVLVLDEKEREPMALSFLRPNIVIHLLDEDKWPDGVHAFRTKAILDGKVPEGLF